MFNTLWRVVTLVPHGTMLPGPRFVSLLNPPDWQTCKHLSRLLCLQSSPRLPFILWPAEGADQHIPLLPNSCLCVGLLNRHQGQKRSRLSVHGGTKDKGMNKIHPLLPGVAPGLLRLCFPIFSLWDMQKKIIWAHGQIDKVTQSWR